MENNNNNNNNNSNNNNRPRPKKRVTRKQLRNRRIGGLIVLLLIIFLLSKGCASCIRCACKSDGKDDGKTSTTTTVSTEAAVTSTTESALPQENLVEKLPASYKIENVPEIYQEPELPTGSEVTALTMLLNYLGFDIDKQTLAQNYLTCADRGDATFSQAFIGSPFDSDGLGCFAPVIVDTAMKYLNTQGSDRTVKSLNADTFDDVLLRVASDQPVLVWINTNLELMQEEYCFTVYGTNGIYTTTPPPTTSVVIMGTTAPQVTEATPEVTTAALADDFKQDVYWIPNATCVLLTGFDTVNDTVTVIDPLQGEITYNMGMFKTSYNALYKQAVVIY